MFKNISYIFTAVFISSFFVVSQSGARDYGDDYSTEPGDETVLDYDRKKPGTGNVGWQEFGCKWVSYDEDRVVFSVRRSAGLFKEIRVKVGNDKAYFINARVVSYGGFRKKFHIESGQSFPGQAVSVQFSDIPRRIRKVTLRYDARMRPGDRTRICLSGKKVRQIPPVLTHRPPMTDMSWKDLGCIKVPKKITDDYLRVGFLKGYFRALRFRVFRSPAMVEDLSVTFEGGRKERLRVQGYVSAGRTSKTYFFERGGRLSVIDITSRGRSLFRSSKICFQGLAESEGASREPDSREAYRNIPRLEEELLDDEQYLGKNIVPRRGRDGDVASGRGSQRPKGLDDYINNIERNKKQSQENLARKREKLKRQELEKARLQRQAQLRQNQLELAEEKRAKARKKLERQAARQRAEQQRQQQENVAENKEQPAESSGKKAKEKQAREDEEAFRKAQEKADKAQAELENRDRLRREAREKAAQARIDAEKQARKQAREQEEATKKQVEEQARQVEIQSQQQRLEAMKQAEKKAEEDKIHSKKAEFPTSKISPDRKGWISYGCQNFGSKIEERYIPVGRLQGTFTKIRVRVSGNSLTLKKMYVVYGNGKSEPLIRYSSRVMIGKKTSDYTLSHRRRFISEVKLKAQSRDRNNENKSLVCLEAYR